MSGKRRSNSRAWLKAVGLAALIAAGLSLLAGGVADLVWLNARRGDTYCRLAAIWVGSLTFFVVLSRRSPDLRRWLAGLSRARHVSLWLLLLTALLFVTSQMWLALVMKGVLVRVADGGVFIVAWEGLTDYATASADAPEGFRTFWMPSVSILPMSAGYRLFLRMPLWMIGAAALWPWWKPWGLWLLGGRVQGHRPLRSWQHRSAFAALLLCSLLMWLCCHCLIVYVEDTGVLYTEGGWICWHQGAEAVTLTMGGRWEIGGFSSLNDLHGWSAPRRFYTWDVTVPVWPGPVLCLLWLILAVRPRHRFRRRWENGLCLQCGYDLRGLKERCTECGQPIEPEQLAQLAGVGDLPESGAGGGRRAADP